MMTPQFIVHTVARSHGKLRRVCVPMLENVNDGVQIASLSFVGYSVCIHVQVV